MTKTISLAARESGTRRLANSNGCFLRKLRGGEHAGTFLVLDGHTGNVRGGSPEYGGLTLEDVEAHFTTETGVAA